MKSLLRSSGYLVTVGLLGFYALYTLRGPQGLGALRERQTEIGTLAKQNLNLKADIQLKKDQIEALKHNLAAQKREIKRRIGLAEEDDTFYVLPDAPPTSTPK